MFENEAKKEPVFNTKLTNPNAHKLAELIAECEAGESSALIGGNTTENWQNFCAHFKVIEAAGGFVRNAENNWLFIYRNGVWDLPKGKLELGESIEECAVREVAEECGIAEPTISKPLTTTYHTYSLNGKRILKPTYWYLMESSDNSELIPQTEEGITEVRWVSNEEALEFGKSSFGSIKQVVLEGFGQLD